LEQIRELLVPFFSRSAAKKAVVFGSYARGEADEHSDLDLIIVAETETPFLERFRDYTGIYKIWRRGLDMLIYTPDELERMQREDNPFVTHALGEGIVIYEE
jgi:predicted nucleotidyltransferase